MEEEKLKLLQMKVARWKMQGIDEETIERAADKWVEKNCNCLGGHEIKTSGSLSDKTKRTIYGCLVEDIKKTVQLLENPSLKKKDMALIAGYIVSSCNAIMEVADEC